MDALMSTTYLTPTQHKGGFASILKVAATIAISAAAPGIGTAIGLSAAIGSTAVAGALVGAGLGAVSSFALGGNPVLGALGGGVGGFASGGGFSGIGGAAPTTTGAAIAPAAAAPAGVASTGLSSLNQSFVSGLGIPTTTFPSAATGVGGLSDTLSGSFNADGVPVGGSGAADTLGATLPPGDIRGLGIPASTPNITTAPFVAGVPNQPGLLTGLSNRATNFIKSIPERAGKALPELGAKVATQFITNALSPVPDQSNQSAQLEAQLARNRAQEQALLDERLSGSRAFTRSAENINPTAFGVQALTAEQNRLARSQQAGLRGINRAGGNFSNVAISSAARRNALDRARLGGFRSAFDSAESRRRSLLAAGRNSLPTGTSISTGTVQDLAASDARFNSLIGRGDNRNAAGLVGPLVNQVFGVDTAAERKRKADAAAKSAGI